MKFNVGDKIRVVNCYSGGNFDNGDIVTVKQIGCDDEPDVYGAISPHDNYMWYLNEDEVAPADCEYCHGEKPIFWHDKHDNVFVNANGEISVTVDGATVSFKVDFCPMCGCRFN